MPPMDAPMDDPMGGMPPMDGSDDGMGEEPMGGDMPPMDGPENEAPDMGAEGGNNEIDDIFNKLSTEDQAAVIKYAKSMAKDDEEESDEPAPNPEGDAPDMQAESINKKLRNFVNEIVNNILGDNDEVERPDNKIRNKKAKTNSPFVTQY